MSWLDKILQFFKDLVCRCMIYCNCKSSCVKEQTSRRESRTSPQSTQSTQTESRKSTI